MARTSNLRRISLFVALPFLLLMLSTTASAQNNIIVNGDFEAGNTGFFTDYIYEPTYGMLAGRYCVDNTVNGHGENNSFLPPSGSSGKYMIVNGFGGNDNQNKVVWRQSVIVTSNTWYTFSFKYANLSKLFLWYGEGAILRFLINGPLQDVNDIQLNAGDQYWHTYPNYRWYSGNVAGEIYIEFRDVFDGSPGDGDDFALDNISFVPDVLYSVNAQDDNSFVCSNSAVSIPVLNNDNVLPNGNNNNVSVQILTPLNQIHGTTTLPTINNNVITYNYNDGTYTGNTADFQYRVTWHGLTSDAWVHISLGRAPTIGSISLSQPITLCLGESLTLPTPTVTPNGSPITNQGWQVKVNGSWQNVNGNTIPSVADGYTSVRYFAENQCDTAYSDEFQLVVSDEPTIGSISNIIPASFCAPTTFSCSPPSIQNNGSEPIAWGWQMQIGGQWVNVPNPIEYQHNGCNIRYYATNDCGTNYSNTVAITVNAAPIVPNITAPAGVCEGQSLVLTPPSNIQWRHNDPNTCSGCWQVYDNITNTWVDLTGNSIPSISYNGYNGRSLRYRAHNGCGDGFSNQVAITVFSAQDTFVEYSACDTYIWINGVVCDHTDDYTTQTQNENGCDITAHLHFTLSDAFDTTLIVSSCDSYYWPKTNRIYYETSVYDTTIYYDNPEICDSTYRLDLTINHAPELTSHQLDLPTGAICSGEPLNVTPPSFANGGEPFWGYSNSPNGPYDYSFNPLANNLGYGSYYLRYKVVNNCGADSTAAVPFRIMEAPSANAQLEDMTVCVDTPLSDYLPEVVINWNNELGDLRDEEWQLSENDATNFVAIPDVSQFQFNSNSNEHYWLRFMGRNNCEPPAYIGPVQLTVLQNQDIPETHEDCDTVWFEGNPYILDTVVDELVNEPCPHAIHHNIIVHHSEYIMEPIPQTTCHDEFVWHGQIYYRSDGPEQLMHFETLTEYDCPKVLEQQLVFSDYSTKIEPRIGCGTYTWPRNDSTYVYDENQMHIQDSWFIPGDGEVCDSIIYLSLDLDREYEYEGDPMTECRGFEWHGVTYYEDAIVYDSLTTKIAHCDSIISYRLTIIQPFDTIVEMESCKPKLWYCQDQENLFDEDGEVFTATLISQMTSCDSIVTIRFSLLPEITLPVEDVLVCEPFHLPDGQIVDHSDLWSYTIHSLDECDTIVPIQVEFIQTDTLIDEPISACNSYTFEGNDYLPGFYPIYYDTVFASDGCIRSVHLLNLTVKDSDQIGTINGASNVYVASSLISGIYRYEINSESLAGPATWSLSNPDWQIIEQGDAFCRVFVSTPGNATLTAHFNVEECGEMERSFEINAVFYGVDDHQGVDVHIFPNPTKGSVTIETEGIESLRLIDMMGQVLETREYDRSDSVTLNLSTYTPSVYLFEIKTVYGVVKKRLILCR